MMFDTEISVFTASVGTPTPEHLEAGAPALVELSVMTGLALPIANPQTGGPLLVPGGQYRFSFSKEQAVEVFSKALEAAQSLPDPDGGNGTSKLVLAKDMNDVKATASALRVVQ